MSADDPAALADRIARLLGTGDGELLVALDHDGTLSPIVGRPEDARLAPGAQEAVRDLCTVAEVAVLSGRGLDDLVARFGGLPVTLVSEHGLRVRTPDGTVDALTEELDADVLTDVRRRLATLLDSGRSHGGAQSGSHGGAQSGSHGGWTVEDKGVSIAVHHRLVPEDALEPTLTAVRELLAEAATAPPGGHVQKGKAVLELRPAGAEKGAALRELLARRPGRCPVMVGDDLTDEPALAAAEAVGGVGVLVAEDPRATAASARLADPSDVVRLLVELEALLRRAR